MFQIRPWSEPGGSSKSILGMAPSLKMKQRVRFLWRIAILFGLSINSPVILQCGKSTINRQFTPNAYLDFGEDVFDLAILCDRTPKTERYARVNQIGFWRMDSLPWRHHRQDTRKHFAVARRALERAVKTCDCVCDHLCLGNAAKWILKLDEIFDNGIQHGYRSSAASRSRSRRFKRRSSLFRSATPIDA